VVVSTVRAMQIADQTRLIDAIKEAGNVKVLFLNRLIILFLLDLLSCPRARRCWVHEGDDE
jgi:hypothetical protein